MLIAVGAGTSVPAGAQDAAAEPAEVAPARLVLTRLAPTVGTAVDVDEVAWRAVVEHIGTEPWERVDVTAELRAAVTTRGGLRAALAGVDVTPLLRRRSVALEPRTLAPGELGVATGAIPLRGLAPAGDPGGVHPLRIRVIADGIEVARLDTAVIRLETAPPTTLATALVWPLTAPAVLPGAEGSTAADAGTLADLIAPGGRLRTAVTALGAADPTVAAGVALAPAAHLLEDLAALAADGPDGDAADVRAAIRTLSASARSGPVITAYGGVDPARLLAATAASDPPGAADVIAATAAAATFEGGRRLLPLTGRAPAPVTLLSGPTTRRALDLVAGTVLVPHAALDLPDPELDATLGEPVRRVTAASGRIVTAVVADPFLADAVAGTARDAVVDRPGGAVAAAQEVLARAALLYLEAPGRTDRGLLLLVPPDLDVDPAAAAELLERLGAAPWLRLVAPATLVSVAGGAGTDAAGADGAGADGAGPVAATSRRAVLLPADIGPAPRLVTALTAATAALDRTVATVAPAAGLDPGAAEGRLVLGDRTAAELRDAILRAAGHPDPDRGLAALAAVRDTADAALGPVAVAAGDLTLTDRAGPLPLAIANAGPLPLAVDVEAVGPAGLAWPEGTRRTVVLPEGGDVALELPVAARATGLFPVRIRVLDAAGGELAVAAVTVRATAVAGPALAGIAVAIAVMTAIGVVRQRRRGRRPAA